MTSLVFASATPLPSTKPNMEIKNAIIESTMLGSEDHGILTAYLRLNYGGSGQGFGGYALDRFTGPGSSAGERVGTAYGMEFIRRVMKTVGVEKWEDLKGKHCRARMEDNGVYAIGHIIEDRWFCPTQDLVSFASKES